MAGRELVLEHSPDSDDLVMWWPLLDLGDGPAVDTRGFVFRCVGEDVERLNQRAAAGTGGDITAISAATYPHVAQDYVITSCGGSFGEGYGPKLVCRLGDGRFVVGDLGVIARDGVRIAVPGLRTTAYLVLWLMVGSFSAADMPFDRVVSAVQNSEADLGLLIHEAQLTFEDEGLRAVADLGAWWEQEHGGPLPLGLNVVRRDLDERFGDGSVRAVALALSDSVRFAVAHPERSREYLLSHGHDRPEWQDAALLKKYLSMYVSELTVDMGEAGRSALARLFREGHEAGVCAEVEVEVV